MKLNNSFNFADLERRLVFSSSHKKVVDDSLIRVVSDFITFGIFSKIETLYGVPWTVDDIQSYDVDIDYFTSHGERIISPLVRKLLSRDSSEKLTDDSITIIARIIHNRFGTNWQKLYQTMKAEYNPIENYSMVERETHDENITRENVTEASGQNDTEQTTSQSGNKTTATSVDNYGFNSSNGQPLTDSDTQENASETINGTNTTGTSYDENRNETSNRQVQTEHTRSGNIGVTTSQQMLNAEREVWLYDFFETIFKQVDTVLTIPYYNLY